jgi:threonine aldolase
MVDRLAEDHDNARLLAEGLSQLPGIRLDLERVQTNIVIFQVDPPGGAEALVREATLRKVKIHQISPTSIRLVTHKDVDREDIHRALEVFRELCRGWPRSSK